MAKITLQDLQDAYAKAAEQTLSRIEKQIQRAKDPIGGTINDINQIASAIQSFISTVSNAINTVSKTVTKTLTKIDQIAAAPLIKDSVSGFKKALDGNKKFFETVVVNPIAKDVGKVGESVRVESDRVIKSLFREVVSPVQSALSREANRLSSQASLQFMLLRMELQLQSRALANINNTLVSELRALVNLVRGMQKTFSLLDVIIPLVQLFLKALDAAKIDGAIQEQENHTKLLTEIANRQIKELELLYSLRTAVDSASARNAENIASLSRQLLGVSNSVTALLPLIREMSELRREMLAMSAKQDGHIASLSRQILGLQNSVVVIANKQTTMERLLLDVLKLLEKKDDEKLKEMKKKVDQIYFLLGGPRFYANSPENPGFRTQLEPELIVKGKAFYTNGHAQINDMVDLVLSTHIPTYFRSGLHRLPAQLPEKLYLKAGEQEKISPVETLVELQQWQFRQTDSVLGSYPISIKYKDAQGAEQTIHLQNMAEATTEIIGLLLSNDSDVDLSNEMIVKLIGEVVQNKAQMSLSVDYLRAIADFLGFKYEVGKKSMPLPINPSKNSIKGFLEKSDQDIQSITLSEPDDNDVISKLNRLLIATGMIKAALSKRTTGGKVDGDLIKTELQQDEQNWDEFLAFLNDIPTGLKDKGDPKPKARDKSTFIQKNNPQP